ncbi:hypothetical protein HDU96_011064 [Phlyctochytrium bullatum]|nr:hypothetical protein HDU96_011064 [Phlyctochytrium bullatum]
MADCGALNAALPFIPADGCCNRSVSTASLADVSEPEQGVTCDQGSSKVVAMYVAFQFQPVGDKALGQLTALETLTHLKLHTCGISGTVPDSISNLKNLRVLDLASNDLSGALPPSLATISSLSRLILNRNKLSGQLPPALWSLSSLSYLCLYQNTLTGSIPVPGTDAQPGPLKTVHLAWNGLTGRLPEELAPRWKGLENLHLQGNFFSGPFPSWATQLGSLKILHLSESGWESTSLPTSLGDQLASLEEFGCYKCNLKGPIPESIGKMQALKYLILDDNKLSGALPATMANLQSLHNLTLARNMLSGDLSALSGLKDLKELLIAGNRFGGSVPEAFAGATVTTENNCFSGASNQRPEGDCTPDAIASAIVASTSPTSPPAPSSGGGSGGIPAGQLAAAILVPILLLTLLAVVAVLGIRYLRNRRRTAPRGRYEGLHVGKVDPPPSPRTNGVFSSVFGSTGVDRKGSLRRGRNTVTRKVPPSTASPQSPSPSSGFPSVGATTAVAGTVSTYGTAGSYPPSTGVATRYAPAPTVAGLYGVEPDEGEVTLLGGRGRNRREAEERASMEVGLVAVGPAAPAAPLRVSLPPAPVMVVEERLSMESVELGVAGTESPSVKPAALPSVPLKAAQPSIPVHTAVPSVQPAVASSAPPVPSIQQPPSMPIAPVRSSVPAAAAAPSIPLRISAVESPISSPSVSPRLPRYESVTGDSGATSAPQPAAASGANPQQEASAQESYPSFTFMSSVPAMAANKTVVSGGDAGSSRAARELSLAVSDVSAVGVAELERGEEAQERPPRQLVRSPTEMSRRGTEWRGAVADRITTLRDAERRGGGGGTIGSVGSGGVSGLAPRGGEGGGWRSFTVSTAQSRLTYDEEQALQDVRAWNMGMVIHWLQWSGLAEEDVEVFANYSIDGPALLALNRDKLEVMGITNEAVLDWLVSIIVEMRRASPGFEDIDE